MAVHGPDPGSCRAAGEVVAPALTNAMSVDVEDYFQVSAFERHIDRGTWDDIPCRVEANTGRVLDLLERHGVRATFFTLGWIAERFPELVRRIVASGHELASHGYDHTRVTEQSPEQFRADVVRTKSTLEDIGGVRIRGFRAASFSITSRTLWALDILADTGHEYSSSIYPVRHDLYGIPSAPRFPFLVAGSGLVEIPVTTVRRAGRNLPCGGGGYFRLLPYAYSAWGYRTVNRVEGRSGVFYCHPWEFDPDQPRVPGIAPRTRLRHYLNLRAMSERLDRLLGDFRWGRMDATFVDGPEQRGRYPERSVRARGAHWEIGPAG